VLVERATLPTIDARRNYGPDGPQHFQILWWAMQPEHWEILRVGGSMNFLVEQF
jgi:hypothetical protein